MQMAHNVLVWAILHVELADSGPFGYAADLGDIGMQRGHPLQGGVRHDAGLEVDAGHVREWHGAPSCIGLGRPER
jgi:hypothetical protein